MRLFEFFTEAGEIDAKIQRDDIAKSLWSLARTNDGRFKSEKQAKFLLSKTHNGEFVNGGQMYNNPYTFIFDLDNEGVVTIHKKTTKNPMELVWERPATGKTSIQQQVAQTRADKHARSLDKHKASRITDIPLTIDGYYRDMEGRDDNYKSITYRRIIELKQELEQLTGKNQDTASDVKHHNELILSQMGELEQTIKRYDSLDTFLDTLRKNGVPEAQLPRLADSYHEVVGNFKKQYDELKGQLL